MKHLLILLCLLSGCLSTGHAGWFFDDPPPPPDHGPQYRVRISELEEQMSEQHAANDRWKIATGGLAVAAVLLFVIGTALGAKTRQSYDSATRRVGRTHTSGVNGTRNHMGETGPPDRHQTMAA